MNDSNDYLNYFQFLKNLKNTPDTGASPLAEWRTTIQFFVSVYSYLEVEWDINLDERLDFQGCKVDDYSNIFRHRQAIADIVVGEFRRGNNISNAAIKVIDYLKQIGLYSSPEE